MCGAVAGDGVGPLPLQKEVCGSHDGARTELKFPARHAGYGHVMEQDLCCFRKKSGVPMMESGPKSNFLHSMLTQQVQQAVSRWHAPCNRRFHTLRTAAH